jgi:uncharacterized membrane-anchored protein
MRFNLNDVFSGFMTLIVVGFVGGMCLYSIVWYGKKAINWWRARER